MSKIIPADDLLQRNGHVTCILLVPSRKKGMKRPIELYFLFLLHLLLSLNALIGGALLMAEPSGSLLGMSPGWLDKTPFPSYLVPGMLLFVLMGLFPLVTLLGLLMKLNLPWLSLCNIYPAKHWAWTYSLFAGLMLIIWIILQQLLTEYFWLQPELTSLGLLNLICTLMPRVQSYFTLHN